VCNGAVVIISGTAGMVIIANIGSSREIGFIREVITVSGFEEMSCYGGGIREIELL
jgi:hypothetical protein